MDTFTKSGTNVNFSSFSGEITSLEKSSESVVGSKPFIGSNQLEISTSVNRDASIWIKSDDGKEKEFKLKTHDFSLKVGHRVTVIMVGLKDQSQWLVSEIINHTAEERNKIYSEKLLCKGLGLNLGNIVMAIGALIALTPLVFAMILVNNSTYLNGNFFDYFIAAIPALVVGGVALKIASFAYFPFYYARVVSPFRKALSQYTNQFVD